MIIVSNMKYERRERKESNQGGRETGKEEQRNHGSWPAVSL